MVWRLADRIALGIAVAAVATCPAAASDIVFGEYLSGECVTCHRLDGRQIEGIPAIVAWPEDQFIVVMESYREQVRENPVMRTIAGRLSDEEIAALAAFFGSKEGAH